MTSAMAVRGRRLAGPAAECAGEVRDVGVAELERDRLDAETVIIDEQQRFLAPHIVEQVGEGRALVREPSLQGPSRDMEVLRHFIERTKACLSLDCSPHPHDHLTRRTEGCKLALKLVAG